MEVINTSETSVNFYQTTRLCIPGDSHVNKRRDTVLCKMMPMKIRCERLTVILEIELKIRLHKIYRNFPRNC
jgi:hypothetical protein